MTSDNILVRIPNHNMPAGESATGHHTGKSFREIKFFAGNKRLAGNLLPLQPGNFRRVTVPAKNDMIRKFPKKSVFFTASHVADHTG